MNPLRRIAFGNWCWIIPAWLCIAMPGMAQTNQVDRAQLFRVNAPPGPLVPAALSPEGLDYAPHSENDADLLNGIFEGVSCREASANAHCCEQK